MSFDRAAFIRGLHTDRLKPDQIQAFFGGLTDRIPGPGTNPDRWPILAAIDDRLDTMARLVHVIDTGSADLAHDIADRMRGFVSDRWTELVDGTSVLDRARDAVGEIAADLAELRSLPLDA